MNGTTDTFKLLDPYSASFDENDPSHNRSVKDARPWMEANDHYSKLHREKQHCSVQASLMCFKKQNNKLNSMV
jgi:hypothetical protein